MSSVPFEAPLRHLVLGLAQIPLDVVLGDLVYHQFHGLRTIAPADPDSLIEIHALLLQLIVVHHHVHIETLVLGIGLPKGELQRANALELFGLVQLKFVVVPLAAFL
jgi:hypothetical protein